MKNAVSVAQSGLQGWRAKVADGVAQPVSHRTGLDAEQVRGGIGILFFALAVRYVYNAAKSAGKQLRS